MDITDRSSVMTLRKIDRGSRVDLRCASLSVFGGWDGRQPQVSAELRGPALLRQNGPPGWTSSTSGESVFLRRNISNPALIIANI